MDRRTDYKTALLIDAAIHSTADSRASPARELAGLGVPFDTARRVLIKKGERRQLPPTPEELAAARRAGYLE